MSLPQCHAAGHPPASRERRSMEGTWKSPLDSFIPLTGSSLPAFVPLASPMLVLLGIQRALHRNCWGRSWEGWEEKENGASVQENCPAKTVPQKKSWKGREHKKAWRMSEARWLSCLVRWKPARVLCLTVRCENNPCAKPVRVALGPKKASSYFVCVVKQDFQSVWE